MTEHRLTANGAEGLQLALAELDQIARRRMLELQDLQQLIVAFAGQCDRDAVFATRCPRCMAERRLRDLAKTFSKLEGA